MIDRKITVTLIMSLVFISLSLIVCVNGNGINKIKGKNLLGRVTCIDKNKVTLNIGNEYNSEIIDEEFIRKNNTKEDILFESCGEERIIEIKNNSTVKIENKDVVEEGNIDDILIGSILSVKYDEENNLVSVLIKDNKEVERMYAPLLYLNISKYCLI